MNNNQNPALRKKIMGSVTFNDDKLRVNYASGTESVLFEDISSISFRRRESPNNLYIILGTLIGAALIFYGIFEASQFLPLTGLIVIILGFICRIYR